MRIALAQTNPTVGDIDANTRTILDLIEQARRQNAGLVVFPELAIVGYPPKDLLLKSRFIDDNLAALQTIAAAARGIEVIVGYADRSPQPVGRPLHNAVAVCRDGQVASKHFKTLLPTYDVFDESRYFEPGFKTKSNQVIRTAGVECGISICEDLWNDERLIARRLYHENPIAELVAQGAKLLINSSASPFVLDKHDFRIDLFAGQCKRFGTPLIYVNQVGGNDELLFDGCSMVIDANGSVIAQAKAFEEDLLVVDLDSKSNRIEKHPTGIESLHRALVLGLRDYVRKCGFRSVVLGLSGGIDSAVTAALAVDALGGEKVVGVAMPSRFSSEHSIEDARELAKHLGIAFHVVPIEPMHRAFEAALAEPFAGREPDVTEENLQARIRGATLMAFSNKFGHLLLTTGNKSEIAVGYCTLYGDMCGGLAVISDVPKTKVYDLARHINAVAGSPRIPISSIEKPPSAELRPNQTDQDSLPPYEILDRIIQAYVEDDKRFDEMVADGLEPATIRRVIRLIDRSEYKRRQAAPGLKVTSRAFGVGRRMPIAQNYDPVK